MSPARQLAAEEEEADGQEVPIKDDRSNVAGDTKKKEESAKDDDEQMLSHASMTSLVYYHTLQQ